VLLRATAAAACELLPMLAARQQAPTRQKYRQTYALHKPRRTTMTKLLQK
jgi:hypothetical protein